MAGVIELPEVTITAGEESEDERRRREILAATRQALQGLGAAVRPALDEAQAAAMPETREGRAPAAFGRADPADVGRGEPPRYAGGPVTPADFVPPRAAAPQATPSAKPGDPVPQAPSSYANTLPRLGEGQRQPMPNRGQEAADRQALADAQAASDQQRRMRMLGAALAGGWARMGPDRMGRMLDDAAQAPPSDPYARAREQVDGRRAEAERQAERQRTEERSAAERYMEQRRAARDDRRLAMDEETHQARTQSAEAEQQLATDLQNPASMISRADQAALSAARDAMGGAMAEELSDDVIATLPAETIRRNPMLSGLLTAQRQLNTQQARRPRGSGGGGGGGGAAFAERRDQAAQAYARRYDVPIEEARAMMPRNPRELDRMLSQISVAEARGDLQARGRQDATSRRMAEDDAGHRVPGWVRLPNAPRLGETERRQARDMVGTVAELRANANELRQLAQEVSALEQAGASAGVVSAKMARARELHESVSNALRTIGGYGVPAESELRRMDTLAPQLQSAGGLLNAQELYRALPDVMERNAANRLRALGYVQPGSRVRVRRNGQTGTVSAQNVRPDDEVIYE